jgi:hypothetical protein
MQVYLQYFEYHTDVYAETNTPRLFRSLRSAWRAPLGGFQEREAAPVGIKMGIRTGGEMKQTYAEGPDY